MGRIRSVICFFLILPASISFLFGQDMETETPVTGISDTDSRLVPVFPDTTEGLIFIEGEDAASTNFAGDPLYNYGCSGLKTLQLSRATGLQGGAAFYTQYVFYVEEPGTYSFCYGGTPPGPREDLYPSYVSPFRYSLDDNPDVSVFREDVVVLEGYTPAYYWVRVGDIELSEGIHTITFRVSEKRGYDGIYFFYLDSFFFVRNDNIDGVLENPGVKIFPRNYEDRSRDNPFLSIADYNKIIQSRPEDPEPYIELSLVYSLIGDYLSALKVLKRAIILDPENSYPLLLSAKNKIWKGDVADGITTYRQVLQMSPDDPTLWGEAAKVAAWSNLYTDALDIYTRALERFPNDISLKVNLALTYLWLSRNEDADDSLRVARRAAEGDVLRFIELGRVFMQNGYPDRAAAVYEEALAVFPEVLELYLLLETSYEKLGMQAEADDVYGRIESRFQPSPELTAHLELFRKKSGLKAALIQDYHKQIEENPENLDLRSFLVQTYFWNGMRKQAIEESLSILAVHAYNAFVSLDARSMDHYRSMDILNDYLRWFGETTTQAGSLEKRLQEGLTAYTNALRAAVKESEGEGNTSTTAREAFNAEEEKITALLDEANAFLAAYSGVLDTYEEALDLERFITRENEDKKAFNLLTKDIGWKWDRRFHLAELEGIRGNDPLPAGYVLARLYQFEDNGVSAAILLDDSALAGSDLPSVRFARYQWNQWFDSDGGDPLEGIDTEGLFEYAPYIPGVSDIFPETGSEDVPAYLYPEDPAAEVGGFLEKLKGIRDAAPARIRETGEAVNLLKRIIRGRMERTFFQIEENTYLLRYELGDYYLAVNEPEQAVEQFRMVLFIDPWNISATYKLGTVQQLSGNWSKAMDSYRRVYWNDPGYPNNLRYYNQLARENADSFSFRSKTLYDPYRLTYTGTAEYHREVNTFLGWDLAYTLKNDRIYNGFTGDSYGAFSLRSLSIGLPVSLYTWNVEIIPFFGAGVYNSLYNTDPDLPSDSSYEPNILFDRFSADPFYGVHGKIGLGPVEIFGGWYYQREADTHFPGRDAVFANAGELQVSTYFTFPDEPRINSVGTRSYGLLEFMTDANLMGTLVQEVVGSFHLADSPWINLDATGVVSYEDSKVPGTADYYSPNMDLTAKGGVRGSMVLPLTGGSLGMSLWVSAGGYRTGDVGSGMSLYGEGYFDMGFYRGYSALTFSLYGSSTFTKGLFPATDYWAFQGALGFSTRLPDLLTE